MTIFRRSFWLGPKPDAIVLEVHELAPAEGEWSCSWSIDWGDGRGRAQNSPGTDKLSALITALKKAEIELSHYNHTHEEKVTWLGESRLPLIWDEAVWSAE